MAFIADTAAASYLDANGNIHLRIYLSDGTNIVERSNDGSGWKTGSFTQKGEKVAVTSWYIGGLSYLRVYCTFEGVTTEWCSDGGQAWYKGAYTDS